jgi:hypothetical protein
MSIESDKILRLIEGRHCNDVFIPECKNGASGEGHLRLDAWAMSKSWAHPRTVGYEIKVSRKDFLNDTKWYGYKKYCNEIYLVSPPKVVKPDDLAPDTGLLWVTSTGSRLYLKKKAQYREQEIPEDFYRYILMCRIKIVESTIYHRPEMKADFWKRWVESKDGDIKFGHMLGTRLSKVVREQIEEVKVKNHELEKRMESYEDVRKKIKELKLSEDWFSGLTDHFENKVKKINELYPKSLMYGVENLERDLSHFKKSIEEWQNEQD